MVRMLRTNRFATGVAVAAVVAATVVGAAGPAVGAPSAHRTLVSGHLDPGLTTHGTQLVRVVVSARAGAAAEAERATKQLGGHVGKALDIIDGFAATVPADRLAALAAQQSVLAVTADRSAKLDDRTFDGSKTASAFVRSTGADTAWSN